MSQERIEHAERLLGERNPQRQVSRILKVSPSTLYRALVGSRWLRLLYASDPTQTWRIAYTSQNKREAIEHLNRSMAIRQSSAGGHRCPQPRLTA